MKSKIVVVLLFLLPLIYLLSRNRNQRQLVATRIEFPEKLSVFKIFTGDPQALVPSSGIELIELSSALFTDYAKKQRLMKLSPGTQMSVTGNGLPKYPEGTMLIKTFYYDKEENNPSAGRQLVETRLLLLKNGHWNAGTYRWNAQQNEAFYTRDTVNVSVEWKNKKGQLRKIGYHIPGQQECISCHQFSDEIMPIGPKAMNLNRTVNREGKQLNQLVYLQNKGLLQFKASLSKLKALPAYEDSTVATAYRARAYMEINCAHCHNPNGLASGKSLLLNYSMPFVHTGIAINQNNIVDRVSSLGAFHMPKLGTTVIDEEGVKLIRDYIKKLSNKH